MSRQRRAWSIVVGLAMVAGCSGGDDPVVTDAEGTATPDGADSAGTTDPASTDPSPDTDDTTPDGSDDEPGDTPTTSLGAPPTTVPRPMLTTVEIDPETGEVTEVEEPAPGPSTFDEVIEFGVEAGLWDELDGLASVLDHVVGELPAEYLPGADEIVRGELTHVLLAAEAAADAGEGDPDTLARIEQRLAMLLPSQEILDQIAEQSGPPIQGFAPVPAAATGCTPVDPDDWDGNTWLDGCYRVVESVLPDATLRVYYPAWYDDDGSLASLPPLTLGALEKSITVYRNLGRVGDVSVVFSVTDTIENGSVLGTAMPPDESASVGGCRVALWPVSSAGGLESFEQTVAHEVWHCVQYNDGMQFSDGDWFVEGGAEFFSNVVYPAADDEHGWLWKFDRGIETPIHQMSYEAWIWWQHLSNEFSPLFVADLHREMFGQGATALGPMAGFEETFHDFTADYVAGAIQDQSGAPLPRTRRFVTIPVVEEGDEGRRLEYTFTSWAPVRFHVPYDKELRFLQSDASNGGLRSMVEWKKRTDRAEWKGIFPEIRSTCTEQARFAGVITDASADSLTSSIDLEIVIDEIEKAECDPCLLGTWSLDLDTFEGMILGAMASEGGGLPPGTSFDFEGAYYMAFAEDSVVQEQRDGLTVVARLDGVGELRTIIDSYATGTYTADGEVLTVTDLAESFNQVRVEAPVPVGAMSFPGAIDSGSGTYTCDEDVLELTVDSYPPITWVRVDKILTPPDAPTDPDTATPTES
jgi:hypothetical protein